MTDYNMMAKQMEALIGSENHYLPSLSNASALLWESLENINWAGFYIVQSDLQKDGTEKKSLLLGPFQGKVACIRIPFGRGVCGTAALENKTQLVKNVHEFPGHIACDSASNSEVVVPLHNADGTVVAVLDIDSPVLNRFTEEDRAGLETFARVLETNIDFKTLK